ncbi:DNA-binding response OmpR family regulator [Croceifilum oryzae]|uniref:DNA-binding response OmpR family regulator n=1 Tax=Croceifilum oryzae TaxID=1553429 RepID=A0AAJ1WNU7_9BACL|nr:response regulator transcription factor [Croceifilum oryzae]MDQ0415887.1 DNA-binding response OmpR family regulator [Croceifilum oryzae]
MQAKILVADDEKNITKAIAYALEREGYTVETAFDGEEALQKISLFHPQLVILDVMMPKKNGFDVCKELQGYNDLGIILLTAKNDLVDKILGLELGADDYVTKPFHIKELLSRVRVILRRLDKSKSLMKDEEEIQVHDLRIHTKQRKAILFGKPIDLTLKEFDLLLLLFSNLERVYTREQLLNVVWAMDYAGGTRTVDIHIQRLRKKLGDPYQKLIQTVYKVGYKASGDLT